MSVRIRVAGIPAPQGSKTRNRAGAVYESSKAVGPWRDAIRTETQRAVRGPLGGPVQVVVTFTLKRPKGHYGTGRNATRIRPGAPTHPDRMPDLDKLCRAVLDGLTEGGAWKDDGQVVILNACKVYGDTPGADIEIRKPRS